MLLKVLDRFFDLLISLLHQIKLNWQAVCHKEGRDDKRKDSWKVFFTVIYSEQLLGPTH